MTYIYTAPSELDISNIVYNKLNRLKERYHNATKYNERTWTSYVPPQIDHISQINNIKSPRGNKLYIYIYIYTNLGNIC